MKIDHTEIVNKMPDNKVDKLINSKVDALQNPFAYYKIQAKQIVTNGQNDLWIRNIKHIIIIKSKFIHDNYRISRAYKRLSEDLSSKKCIEKEIGRNNITNQKKTFTRENLIIYHLFSLSETDLKTESGHWTQLLQIV